MLVFIDLPMLHVELGCTGPIVWVTLGNLLPVVIDEAHVHLAGRAQPHLELRGPFEFFAVRACVVLIECEAASRPVRSLKVKDVRRLVVLTACAPAVVFLLSWAFQLAVMLQDGGASARARDLPADARRCIVVRVMWQDHGLA